MIKLSLLAMVCVTSQALTGLADPVQDIAYQFAYMKLTPNGQVPVVLVDPMRKTTTTNNIQMFPSGGIQVNIFPTWVSPSKEWVALDYHHSQPDHGDTLRLINLRSGETRDIGQNLVMLDFPLNTEPDQVLAWSPNSESLAFGLFSQTNSDIKPFLYDVPHKTLTPIDTDQNQSLRFSCSTDSSLLMIQGGRQNIVRNVTQTTSLLNIISIKSNALIESYDISKFGTDFTTSICGLQWSPDAQYVAFVSTCDPSASTAAREVYLWSINTRNLIQATSLTTPLLTNTTDPGNISAYYTLHWLTSNQLLIGTLLTDFKSQQSPLETAQSVIYDTATTKLSTLATGQIGEFTTNPITGQPAFSVASAFTFAPPIYQLSPIDAHLVVGSKSSTLMTSVLSGTSFPNGTNLYWSPDGKMLAYRQFNSSNFIFIDATTDTPGIVNTISDTTATAENSSDTLIIPIGWVSANSPTATSTAQPATPSVPNGGSVPGDNKIGS